MDHRKPLEKLAQDFSLPNLQTFLRAACGAYRPAEENFSVYIQDAPVEALQKAGQIEYEDGRRLMVAAGRVVHELTSRSGKKQQYELAKKILKDQAYDAGIFIFYDPQGHFRFSLVVAIYQGVQQKFSSFRRYTYFVTPDLGNRTFLEQIGKADFSNIESILQAFSVDVVTKEFFQEYRRIFEQAEAALPAELGAEQKRLYTQKFFNRLMFLAFLERKGWLRFNGRVDYLRAVYEDYHQNDPDKRREANFHRKRLNTLFFSGLNNAYERGLLQTDPKYKILRDQIGEVPYLNGGLFEEDADDQRWFFPDRIVAQILSELLYRFNFTVTESTPLDVEVAVDPEMLGKIFEELVTGRHETGSYYTPKPVVAFMCREALKGYLQQALPGESAAALARFVDENDPAGLHNPEKMLDALRRVRACDPACGSGAYLLGMLHELLEQRDVLFASRGLDAHTVYERKLEIIQQNLYGVDIDPFAVNIARLRLWLSLIVDYEGDDPPPLPNLDFKIEAGDSLTAPDPSGGLELGFRYQLVQDMLVAKEKYLRCADPQEKTRLKEQITKLRQDISNLTWAKANNQLQATGSEPGSKSFDWGIEFAEVFATGQATGTVLGQMGAVINTQPGQMQLTPAKQVGGFDIVLTNPPYVRQELLGAYKDRLRPIYPEVYTGTADLYVFFYARVHQLLKPGGVASLISSNKWLRAGYGEKLCQHLLDDQAFLMVVDFGELPVFQTAATFPAIFVWRKEKRGNTPTQLATVKNLEICYDEGITEHVTRISQILPASQFGKGKARLARSDIADLLTKMEANGQPLGKKIGDDFYRGVTTGLNQAFIIDRITYEQLIQDHSSKEIIKPVLVGDDIRRFEVQFREKYLIFTRRGINIQNYPAVYSHLLKYKRSLMPKKSRNEKYGRKPGDYKWYEIQDSTAYYPAFDTPKIIYPDIAKEPRFYLDESRIFVEATGFVIPSDDYFLLAVLNSYIAFEYLKAKCSVLGDQEKGGRIRFKSIYMKNLPIPEPTPDEREKTTLLAKDVQSLHGQRRRIIEQFLRHIGIDPAQSNSRNPLEQPWTLNQEEFTSRAKSIKVPEKLARYQRARDETMALTEEITRIEAEIDEWVKSLYGL